MFQPFKLPPGDVCDLEDFPTLISKPGIKKEEGEKLIQKNAAKMAELAQVLYAEDKQALLLVLQGMDGSGKDGTIRSVMQGVNPRSCQVVSFKKPSELELDHDFLWRIHNVVPRRGNIGIFNRSHYEDVLVVRVHELVPEADWRKRFDHINQFEKMLAENGTRILKCYLHISYEEQRKRLQARVDNPHDHWKFNPQDLEERKRWPEYRTAYNEAITLCNTNWAPWYIIPADRKWYRNLLISELLLHTLMEIDPQKPAPITDYSNIIVE
ncbi:MAG TPA: polyphosphate kinase 2 family protein [Pirellulaceae bacterium]|nr:polyphosphate kinase 2 family protein [Pirellulaceae bacterium]HMO91587.1 polyphosphate kinase 2 family protein [Pirellulaceae bacterium]HMP68284.1 polyphosphate kinase 2 family protein [Pirellulaceae bacterium]